MSHEARTEAFYSHGVERYGTHHGNYLNFGLWENGIRDYVEAAEHLIERLGAKVALGEDSVLLDVACGMGTQDLFLMQRFRCRSIEAVDLTRKHIEIATARNGFPNLTFRVGDACALPFEAETFTHATAVEGIVHFNSRERFFSEVRRVLQAGGRLGIADFCLGREPRNALDRMLLRVCRRAWHIPRANTDTVRSYAANLERSGFDDVDIEVVGPSVVPGYLEEQARHETRKALYTIRGPIVGRLSLVIDRFVHMMYRRGLLEYILVAARKG